MANFTPMVSCSKMLVKHHIHNSNHVVVKPGVHTNDFAPIHGRRARIHTAPAESTVDSTYCLPQALCEYGRADRESGRNR